MTKRQWNAKVKELIPVADEMGEWLRNTGLLTDSVLLELSTSGKKITFSLGSLKPKRPLTGQARGVDYDVTDISEMEIQEATGDPGFRFGPMP